MSKIGKGRVNSEDPMKGQVHNYTTEKAKEKPQVLYEFTTNNLSGRNCRQFHSSLRVSICSNSVSLNSTNQLSDKQISLFIAK